MTSIKLFYHPNSTTCVGIQIPPTRTLRKSLSLKSSSSKSFARDRAKELLTEAKKRMELRSSSFSSLSHQFVPAASISHEIDGCAASILHYDNSYHSLKKESNINGVGVDIVLPSRIEKQCRRNWGTHEFSRRWLGIENVKQLEVALRTSEEKRWKEIPARSNNMIRRRQDDPLTLSCALMWGWRESTIKALSDFKFLEKVDANPEENKGSSAAPTFSIQHTKIGSISTSSFVVDVDEGSSLTLIQVGQMVRCGAGSEEAKVLEQWRASLAKGGSSTLNRMNAEKVSMGAIVLNPGRFEKVGETVVVCFTVVE